MCTCHINCTEHILENAKRTREAIARGEPIFICMDESGSRGPVLSDQQKAACRESLFKLMRNAHKGYVEVDPGKLLDFGPISDDSRPFGKSIFKYALEDETN